MVENSPQIGLKKTMERLWNGNELGNKKRFTFVFFLFFKKRSKGKFDRFICLRLEYSIGSLGLARCNEISPSLGKKGREIWTHHGEESR